MKKKSTWRTSNLLLAYRWFYSPSLVAQWLRIHLPMQGTRVRALVQEDPTCCEATKPVRHNYWTCALEPMSHHWGRMPQQKYYEIKPITKLKRFLTYWPSFIITLWATSYRLCFLNSTEMSVPTFVPYSLPFSCFSVNVGCIWSYPTLALLFVF